jgi:uncharacterized membrane protein
MNIGIFQILVTYLVGAVAFFAIDFIWLAKVAPKLYRDNIGHLMADKPNVPAAIAFYSIFLVGLLVFVIIPALEKSSLAHAAIYGALFGFFTYATFDLTSNAIFKNWPFKITVIDMLWGTILCCLISVVTYAIVQKIF